MSERILRALMQLFAIIAKDDEVSQSSRSVVQVFLKQQVPLDQVDLYLGIFDEHVAEHSRLSKSGRKRKRTSVNSVKVLLICTQINAELAQKQKIVVFLRLLEFVYSGEEITEQELEFVHTVGITFNLTEEEYQLAHDFVKNDVDQIENSPNLLFIQKYDPNLNASKFIKAENLKGCIKVLALDSVGMYMMRHSGKEELFLNGQLTEGNRVYFLTHGSSIRNPLVAPIYYSDITGKFYSDTSTAEISYQVKSIEFKFDKKKYGLHELNLNERSGNLIGIMGASGAGKSTLLSILNGTTPPTSGEVLINGLDIHHQKDELEGIIGHISQDDLLIEDLTVFQNLYYNTKLCYDKLSEKDILKKVIDLLKTIGLYEIKDLKVGSPLNKKISGGQRKRLNIALELIREPSVLFVDEPTSGLSSRDSENIMDLLKELTQKGKLVFVVIHQPSSDIFKMFDNLLILDTGGYPIYYGNPIDAVIYFKEAMNHVGSNESECGVCGNVNPEQIFNIIETKVVDEYGQITSNRKISPVKWSQIFHEKLAAGLKEQAHKPGVSDKPKGNYKIPAKWNQFKVFTLRDSLSKLANKQYMLINFLEAPLLAFVLAYLVKFYSIESGQDATYLFKYNENIPAFLFMSVVVALFMGLTVAAEEIISDRKILKREAFLNLSRFSYLNSKLLILFSISAVQTLTFVLIGNLVLGVKGMYLDYWLILFTTSCFANVLGLNISAAFDSVKAIYIFIPIILIPQLLLSGVIVKFDKLNPTLSSQTNVPWAGELMTSRWAFEALATNQFINNDFEKEFYTYDQLTSIANYKKGYWIKELEKKLNPLKRAIKQDEPVDKEFIYNWNLVKKEMQEELEEGFHEHGLSQRLLDLKPEELTSGDIDEALNTLKQIRSAYISIDNEQRKQKNAIIYKQQLDDAAAQAFIDKMNDYENENLGNMLKNKSEEKKIIEFEGELIQKIDPIFKNGEGLRAHFFAPNKKLFGTRLSTFVVNTIVIWLMTIGLFILLYFDFFAKALNKISNLSYKFGKE